MTRTAARQKATTPASKRSAAPSATPSAPSWAPADPTPALLWRLRLTPTPALPLRLRASHQEGGPLVGRTGPAAKGGRAGQLAWLTVDMLKSGTRNGGITVRWK
ncbi:hypothetical protein GCM10022419_043840 [Nonomuraea rosea]|uniref:Uncharacterized protein n=1 Tax=Nonomuraea rosea TaxID=638574 RepID=A0ABP6WXZ3_9ACTN